MGRSLARRIQEAFREGIDVYDDTVSSETYFAGLFRKETVGDPWNGYTAVSERFIGYAEHVRKVPEISSRYFRVRLSK